MAAERIKVILGNAVSDEWGRSRNGKPGDQKQKSTPDYSGEVKLRPFYMNKKGWLVLRWKDSNLALMAAKLMTIACNNKNVGYSQNDRDAIIRDGVDSDTPTNCDCSSLIRAIVMAVSGKKVPDFYTVTEVEILLKTGLFKPVFKYKAGTTLYTGDILCTPVKGHTAMVAEGMPYANPFARPACNVTSKANAKKTGCRVYISEGEGVQWVQYELAQHQFQEEIDSCGGIDGDCGKGTVQCIKEYQKLVGLDADGICGPKTIEKLIGGAA